MKYGWLVPSELTGDIDVNEFKSKFLKAPAFAGFKHIFHISGLHSPQSSYSLCASICIICSFEMSILYGIDKGVVRSDRLVLSGLFSNSGRVFQPGYSDMLYDNWSSNIITTQLKYTNQLSPVMPINKS